MNNRDQTETKRKAKYIDQGKLASREHQKAIREKQAARERKRRERQFRCLQRREWLLREVERLKTAPFSWQVMARDALKEG